jgi:hypothetical protein
MAATFNDIFKNLLSGQILVRIFSFLFNFILLRITDPSTLGFFNVRLFFLFLAILINSLLEWIYSTIQLVFFLVSLYGNYVLVPKFLQIRLIDTQF